MGDLPSSPESMLAFFFLVEVLYIGLPPIGALSRYGARPAWHPGRPDLPDIYIWGGPSLYTSHISIERVGGGRPPYLYMAVGAHIDLCRADRNPPHI